MTKPTTPPSLRYGAQVANDDDAPNGADLWRQAKEKAQKKITRDHTLQVYFDRGPVCIINSADWHLPSEGTDYAQLEQDIELARRPGFFMGLAGDLTDNWVIGRLSQLLMFQSFKITEQWEMLRYALSLIPTEKLIWSVNGNHDEWTRVASGIDYLAEVASLKLPRRAIARHSLTANIMVGNAPFTWRIRHSWRGGSQYNATHGIEQSLRLDGQQWDVGVGAHIHKGAQVREFVHNGETKLAVLCGAYKVVDEFPDKLGFPSHNRKAAAYVVMDEDGSMWGTSSREVVSKYMDAVYSGDTARSIQ